MKHHSRTRGWLAIGFVLGGLTGCHPFRAYPKFDVDREVVGQQWSLLANETRPVWPVALRNGPVVQVMPLYLARRSDAKWANLVGNVHVERAERSRPTGTPQRIFLVANDHATDAFLESLASLPNTGRSEERAVVTQLQQREAAFLARLDGSGGASFSGANVQLVCLPEGFTETTPVRVKQCAGTGGDYEIEIRGAGGPTANFPFSVELNNDLLGFALGIGATLIFASWAYQP